MTSLMELKTVNLMYNHKIKLLYDKGTAKGIKSPKTGSKDS